MAIFGGGAAVDAISEVVGEMADAVAAAGGGASASGGAAEAAALASTEAVAFDVAGALEQAVRMPRTRMMAVVRSQPADDVAPEDLSTLAPG
jgi:hypothetical protein